MNLYSTSNRIYLKYIYPRYLNYTEEGEFIMIPINQVNFDFFLYINVHDLFHSKQSNVRFYYYNIVKSNLFSNKQLEQIEKMYINIQKFKFALSKFKQIVYMKFKKKFNDKTLLYESFPKNTISVYENGWIYTFGDLELYKMIENCFNYDCYGVPMILKLKNPYTNIPFSFHNLIYIYFELMKFAKHSYFFGLYFKHNFNKTTMLQLYKPHLFVNCLKKKYEFLSQERKKTLLYQMLNDYNDLYSSFQNVNYDKLEYLFGNYVIYYYLYKRLKSNFSSREYRSLYELYERKFDNILKKTYRKNPSFGRRTYYKTISGKYSHYINDTLR